MNENYNITLLNTPADQLPENLRINVRSRIDHTLLDPAATKDQIITLCEEALEFGFASVCVAPCWIPVCRRKLFNGAETRITTVIGFPHGNESTDSKVFAARDAIMAGADEIDMVINIGWVKQRSTVLLENELRRMVSVCGRHVILKVIIECCLLTDEEKVYISKLCAEAGVDYVKTSTGFSTGGATLEDIKLIRDTVGERCSIKAAGGIRTLEDARAFALAGCSRIGCSRSVSIAQKEIEEEKRWQDENDMADFWERTERISNYMAAHYERDKAVALEVKRRRDEYDRLMALRNSGGEIDEQELEQLLDFNVYELKWEYDKAHGNEPDRSLIPYLRHKD
ncbi:MAG: deoxyribose-phosphate aldolase [Clostridia bacterium]|nr:deoxyribose-phosphate aldolase [Clostridia bacterium]MBR4955808.1 deoxyribose-phosphate aldolase [Clostridia bacterium]MBR5902645.1 deoxyribose-phosphate aldolase [Clostridia bacterium]